MPMPNKIESDSRKLLGRLRDTMAEEAKGQERLDKITLLISSTIGTEFIYFAIQKHWNYAQHKALNLMRSTKQECELAKVWLGALLKKIK